ncbi:Ryanodine receptor 2 [Pteropus alecto]|uniref:Ryanodine receptor 2 n=1 Tax=Pteropus alecto TaxID=9402 RepID=L5K1A0_PTEAL|nr:Ryanodine receptor 2 [Pteropus alecto]
MKTGCTWGRRNPYGACLPSGLALRERDAAPPGSGVCPQHRGVCRRSYVFLENKTAVIASVNCALCVFLSRRPFPLPLQTAQGGGHRTLLYGHAILLRHSCSGMYLCCLSTSRSSTDKLAFDVGLQEDTTGEACWWTIHPASKQRSEGEKVRVGDDLILVSVSSERYLHLSYGDGSLHVDAAFQQTLWSVAPISSGSEAAQGENPTPMRGPSSMRT